VLLADDGFASEELNDSQVMAALYAPEDEDAK
jgi:hypothetical protein